MDSKYVFDLEKYQVSYQSKVNYVDNLNISTLQDVINTIKSSGEMRDLVTSLRAIGSREEQKVFKTKNFPYFNLSTFAGNYRRNKNLISTEFLLFDYDDLDERLEETANSLRSDNSVFAFFISPRGNGLKVIYRLRKPITDPKIFSRIYKHYAAKFNFALGAEPDKTSDASRPCFFSYDPDIYVNLSAVPLCEDILSIATSTERVLNMKYVAQNEEKCISNAVEFLRSRLKGYQDWYQCGLALADLGEDGREYFQLLSDNPKYNDSVEDIDQKYDNFLETKTGEITISTLFHIAKKYGYIHSAVESCPVTSFIPFDIELEEQFKLDDTRDPNKLLGFPLTKFKELAGHVDGLQAGFYLLGAESNIGKTAVLTNMCLDVLDTNPDAAVIYFSLDDSRKYTSYRFLSIMTGLSINECHKKQTDPVKDRILKAGRQDLIDLVRSGRLTVLDTSEITNVDELKAVIAEYKNKSGLVVFIDGLYNLEVGERFKGGIREENIERARQVKLLVDTHRIPILTTGELRKKTKEEGKDKAPTVHDLMETGKFAYNANVVWLLYGKLEDLKTDEPTLTLEYVKNKLSDYKGIQHLRFKRAIGTMEELSFSVSVTQPKPHPFEDGGGLE